MQMTKEPLSADSPETPAADAAPRVNLGSIAGRYGVLLVWLLIIVGFSLLEPDDFPTTANLQTILGSQSVLLILTLGLIVPLTAGEFDLSISGVLSVSLVLVGYLNVVHGWPVLAAAAVAIAAGALVGGINAFFVVVVGVDSLIATLGMGTLLGGVGLGINHVTVAPISQSLVDAMRTEVLGVQVVFFYGLALTILCWYLFSHTPLGRYLQFVGAGREVARLAGLRVNALRVGALMTSATVAAVAGVVLAGSNGSADPNVGASYLLPAFAAAFLGSTVFQPGRFNPWGSFVAVYFLVTGITGLELKGLASWIEPVFYGGSLVLAVAASRILGRRAASS